MQFLLDALNRVLADDPFYPDSIVCSRDVGNCMAFECSSCGLHKFDLSAQDWIEQVGEVEIGFEQWVGGSKEVVNVSLKELVDKVRTMIPGYMRHCFVKRTQSNAFQRHLNNLEKKGMFCWRYVQHLVSILSIFVMPMKMDFSENLLLKEQDASQSAHWTNRMLTVYTAVVWTKYGTHSFAVVSDHLSHDKVAVLSFTNVILDTLDLVGKKLIVFTDGPSCQFKNHFILSALPIILSERQLASLAWNFFATSHGKGAVDGIGGEVKRLARTLVMSRRATIRSLSDFVLAVKPERIHASLNEPKQLLFITSLHLCIRQIISVPKENIDVNTTMVTFCNVSLQRATHSDFVDHAATVSIAVSESREFSIVSPLSATWWS